MPNRLAAATSPYLLQHKDNPVDWYEWSPEAFAAAREQDRPILLSVGYSACHWCHVMAHESFEDPGTAAVMNSDFVSIKVDREERPDVDAVYMGAVQSATGRGGWPMTVFLTPDGKPFYAGTYYPPDDRSGYPSFRRVLAAVGDAWKARRAEVEDAAAQLADAVRRSIPPGTEIPNRDALVAAYEALRAAFDWKHGGFGEAPKFPQAPTLEYLLRIAGEPWAEQAAAMLESTLVHMARGGIHDHLGGGFARYSVDAVWLIPHFEKMLYDNALLARLYLRSWQVTGNVELRDVAVRTLEYMLSDLRLPGGGFASAEDADSDGVEGKFYAWTDDEFRDVCGEDADVAAALFSVTPSGNFEGANVLSLPDPGSLPSEETIARVKGRLLERRNSRVRPGRDDKVVAAWNALAIRAFAEAGAVLEEPRYLDVARATARFLANALRRPDGRLLRSWREGRAEIPGFCADYAALAVGLLALYQATGETEWFQEARTVGEDMVDLFADGDGAFFTTGRDAETLIVRPMDLMDNPEPSANSLAAEALLQLALYTGDASLRERLDAVIRHAGKLIEKYPSAAGYMLAVLHTASGPTNEVAIVGSPRSPTTAALTRAVRVPFRPGTVAAFDPGDGSAALGVPLLEGRVIPGAPPQAFVCHDFRCDAPTSDPEVLADQLGS